MDWKSMLFDSILIAEITSHYLPPPPVKHAYTTNSQSLTPKKGLTPPNELGPPNIAGIKYKLKPPTEHSLVEQYTAHGEVVKKQLPAGTPERWPPILLLHNIPIYPLIGTVVVVDTEVETDIDTEVETDVETKVVVGIVVGIVVGLIPLRQINRKILQKPTT